MGRGAVFHRPPPVLDGAGRKTAYIAQVPLAFRRIVASGSPLPSPLAHCGRCSVFRLMETSTTITVLPRALGALLACRVMVSVLAVMLAPSLVAHTPRVVAAGTGGASILAIGFVVAAVGAA